MTSLQTMALVRVTASIVVEAPVEECWKVSSRLPARSRAGLLC